MCLLVKNVDTPTEIQEVYKVVYIKNHRMYTYVLNKPLRFGWFKAKKRFLYRLGFKKTIKYSYDGPMINGGAIHVYTSLERAEREARSHEGKVLKCQAHPNDFLANGLFEDACYTKIFIPKEGNE